MEEKTKTEQEKMEMEQEFIKEQEAIKIYARLDEENHVARFLDSAHHREEIRETDILVEEGMGDWYAYPHAREEEPLIVRDENGLFNWKYENGAICKRTQEEKETELEGIVSRQELTTEERLSAMEMALIGLMGY